MAQRMLRLGLQGADVRQMQGCLNLKVHSIKPSVNNALPRLTPDGIFGPKTQAKLKEFQRREKLAADGIAGPKTFSFLFSLAPYWTSTYRLGTDWEAVEIESPWGPVHEVLLSADGTKVKGLATNEWEV